MVDSIDINEYRKYCKVYYEKAADFLKEEKNEEAVKYYEKSKSYLEILLNFDANQSFRTIYNNKKKEIEKKIEEIESKKKRMINEEIINSKDNEILYLKNELKKANILIEQQQLKIYDLQNQLKKLKSQSNTNSSNYSTNIKTNNGHNNNGHNPQIFTLNQMMSVNFISNDQRIHYSIPCVGNNTFAEVEEKLYLQFPQYRETNNVFLANGKNILRFKTISENNIGNGFPVTMIIP